MCLMMGDNVTYSRFGINVNDGQLFTTDVVDWIQPGSLLLLDRNELVTVDDVTTDTVNNTMKIQFPEKLRGVKIANSQVLLYGHPLEVMAVPDQEQHPGPPPYTVQKLVVKSSVKIYDADVLAIRFSNLPLQSASLANTTPEGEFVYEVTLQNNVQLPPEASGRRPVVGDTIYLRAYPAYESNLIPLPTIPPHQDPFGPFLVDYLSGTTLDETSFEEWLQVTTYDDGLNEMWTKVMEKNDPILQRTVKADALLFWQVLHGKINWNGSHVLALPTTPPEGDVDVFALHYKCVPELPPGQVEGWRLKVTNDNAVPVRLVVTLDPNPPQPVIDVPAGSTQSVTISFPDTFEPVQRLYLYIVPIDPVTGEPGGSVTEPIKLGGWYLVNSRRVDTLRYTYLVKSDVRMVYGATGLFAKPLFLLTDYLKASLNFDAKVNNGKVVIQP